MIAKRVTAPNQLDLGLNLSTKKTRKREFLEEMNRVVPWSALVALIEPHAPRARTGRPHFAIETMLRVHFLQQWFSLSDPAMEEALHDVPLYREFTGLDGAVVRLPDETTILRFRHLLEAHDLAARMLSAVNGHALLHGQEEVVFADAAYQGAMKRQEATGVQWQLAMRAVKRRALDKSNPIDALSESIEKLKASVRAKVEHPFRVIKRQFGFMKVRYRGLAKNTAQIKTLFALSNLWMARKRILQGAQA